MEVELDQLTLPGYRVAIQTGRQALGCYCKPAEYLAVARIMQLHRLPTISATVRYLLAKAVEAELRECQPPVGDTAPPAPPAEP